MAYTSSEMSPMNGGDGLYSYNKNSTYQRQGMDNAKALISEAIADIFDVNQLISSSNSLNIADLGCSVGPNTFIAVKNIVESIKLKCQSRGLNSEAVEFLVFFNDIASNDFNTLFKSLPHDKQYFAAGVPGSFHGRLFNKASLQFVNSSYALQWLSRVPKEVVDKKSPAWNKGRIYYSNAPDDVVEAYSAQFASDLESFLNARAHELVCGGLMSVLIPSIPVGVLPSQSPLSVGIDLLGTTLLDMVTLGLVSEDKVDAFNFPHYTPTPQELEKLIEGNGSFRIVKMEPFVRAPTTNNRAPNVKMFVLHMRAAWEGVIKEHFGSKIIDELFDRLAKKVSESDTHSPSSYKKILELFVLLQRKTF